MQVDGGCTDAARDRHSGVQRSATIRERRGARAARVADSSSWSTTARPTARRRRWRASRSSRASRGESAARRRPVGGFDVGAGGRCGLRRHARRRRPARPEDLRRLGAARAAASACDRHRRASARSRQRARQPARRESHRRLLDLVGGRISHRRFAIGRAAVSCAACCVRSRRRTIAAWCVHVRKRSADPRRAARLRERRRADPHDLCAWRAAQPLPPGARHRPHRA